MGAQERPVPMERLAIVAVVECPLGAAKEREGALFYGVCTEGTARGQGVARQPRLPGGARVGVGVVQRERRGGDGLCARLTIEASATRDGS